MWRISSASCSASAAEARALQAKHDALGLVICVEAQSFVQKKAISGMTAEKRRRRFPGGKLAAELEALFEGAADGAEFRRACVWWLDAEAEHVQQLNVARQYAAWAALAPAGRHKHLHGVLFRVPHKLDMERLVRL